MLQKIFSRVKRTVIEAASQLAPVNMPKSLPRAQLTIAPYLKTAKPSEASALQLTDRRLANKDVLDYRSGASTRAIVRDFAAASPDISAAINAALRTAITDSFTAVSRNMDGTINPEATALVQQIIARFNNVSDYQLGYADRNSLRSTSEAWGRELLQYGSCAAELVLDKTRLP